MTITTIDDPGDSLLMAWIRDHLAYPHDYCLIWPFARNRNGYGTVGREGRQIYVHRYICELVKGPPPTPEHQAAHSCGRGEDGCVNGRHLSWKTASENQFDRGPSHGPVRKLTPEQVVEIRSLKSLEHVTVTAERFGVTEANIRQIQSGKIWRRDKPRHRVFTADEVRMIRASKISDEKLGKQLGAGRGSIWRVRTGKSYGYVTAEQTGK